MCVRACVCATHGVIRLRLKYEVAAGPDLIPSRSGVRTLRSAGLYRYQHVEVDSSLFVSERICGVRCRKLRHYSIIPFLLSLSVYSELTAIKTFTGINLAQSLHVCKPWCKRVLVWYPLARLHGLKTEIFPTLLHNQLPRPPYRKHTEPWHHVSYRTEPWILWTVTPLIYIYIYIYVCVCMCIYIYVTLDHKTSLKLNWDLYIIWKLGK